MNAVMVLGLSGAWTISELTGHLPSGLGVDKRWDFSLSLFQKERGRKKWEMAWNS